MDQFNLTHNKGRQPLSPFRYDWTANTGLDLKIIEWEERVNQRKFNPIVLELGMTLYSAFRELRTVQKIISEGKPGLEHSFYLFHFELFSHNHFLSIAVNRVVRILKIGYPEQGKEIENKFSVLIKKVNSFRDSLEHQAEIRKAKDAPKFFNNLSNKGYESQGNQLAYKDVELFLNEVMAILERKME